MKNTIYTIFFLLISAQSYSQTILKNSTFQDNWVISDESTAQTIIQKFSTFLESNDYDVPQWIEVKERKLISYRDGVLYEMIGELEDHPRLYQVIRIGDTYKALQNQFAFAQINKVHPPDLTSETKLVEYLTLYINNFHLKGERLKIIHNERALREHILNEDHLYVLSGDSAKKDYRIGANSIGIGILNSDNSVQSVSANFILENDIYWAIFEVKLSGEVTINTSRVSLDRIEFFKEEISNGGFYVNPDPVDPSNKTEWSKAFRLNPSILPYNVDKPWYNTFANRTKDDESNFIIASYVNGSWDTELFKEKTFGHLIADIQSRIAQVSNTYRFNINHYIIFRDTPFGSYSEALINEFDHTFNDGVIRDSTAMFFQIYKNGKLHDSFTISLSDINESKINEDWKFIRVYVTFRTLIGMQMEELEHEIKKIEGAKEAAKEIDRLMRGN